MVRTKLPPDQRRAEIIAAARQLFITKGVAKTSVSSIVKSAGVAQGTFYWHFTSKDEVINAVVEEMAEEVCSAITAISQAAGLDPLQKLARIWEILIENVTKETKLLEFLHKEENRQLHDQLAQEVTKRLGPVFVRIINDGVAVGVFDTPYPEEAVAFLVAVTGTIHEEIFVRQNESVSRLLKALMDFMFKGLGCKIPMSEPEKINDGQKACKTGSLDAGTVLWGIFG